MTEADLFPIRLSLGVAAVALLVVTPPGLFIAWVQARVRYRLRTVVDALVLLPLVIPPSVTGYFLIVTFGRNGLLGGLLDAIGLRLVFTPAASVIASALVALPIVVKTAQPAIAGVPRELIAVARSLGCGPVSEFFRVTLPFAWPGVAAALVLGFARAIGEFGATLMFAGNIPGRTNTMPLEIFAAYQAGEDGRALTYVVALTAISIAVVVVASRLSPGPEAR
jgi:molybdate transport system permease protein